MHSLDAESGSLFSCVDLDERFPTHYPLSKIHQIVNDALVSMDAEFDRLYPAKGVRDPAGASIACQPAPDPALVPYPLDAATDGTYGYNLLFRWFVRGRVDDPT